MWGWLTGQRKPKTPKEMMNECQVDLIMATRQLDRSIQDMQHQDAQLLKQAKVAAEQGKVRQARQTAKQVIRYRGAVVRMQAMKHRMSEISININMSQSTQAMQVAILGVTRAMAKINTQFNVPKMTEIMKTFQKETYKMDSKQEMMDDAMDESMAQFDDDDAENELVQQVMDEIGLKVSEQLANAPTTGVGSNTRIGTSDTDTQALLSRLKNLRQDNDNNSNAPHGNE